MENPKYRCLERDTPRVLANEIAALNHVIYVSQWAVADINNVHIERFAYMLKIYIIL